MVNESLRQAERVEIEVVLGIVGLRRDARAAQKQSANQGHPCPDGDEGIAIGVIRKEAKKRGKKQTCDADRMGSMPPSVSRRALRPNPPQMRLRHEAHSPDPCRGPKGANPRALPQLAWWNRGR